MRKLSFVLAALLAASLFAVPAEARGQQQTAARGTPGAYDYLLLTLSWAPQYCQTHDDPAECGRGIGFIVHGLWPQYQPTGWPQNCAAAPYALDPRIVTAMTPLMISPTLMSHEWTKHGTCYADPGTTQPEQVAAQGVYFGAITRTRGALAIPAGLSGASFSLDEVKALFSKANNGLDPAAIKLECAPGNMVSQVDFCLDKSLNARQCVGVADKCTASQAVTFNPQ